MSHLGILYPHRKCERFAASNKYLAMLLSGGASFHTIPTLHTNADETNVTACGIISQAGYTVARTVCKSILNGNQIGHKYTRVARSQALLRIDLIRQRSINWFAVSTMCTHTNFIWLGCLIIATDFGATEVTGEGGATMMYNQTSKRCNFSVWWNTFTHRACFCEAGRLRKAVNYVFANSVLKLPDKYRKEKLNAEFCTRTHKIECNKIPL